MPITWIDLTERSTSRPADSGIEVVQRPRIAPGRILLAVAIVVLNLADVVLTKVVLHHGGVESNPLMRPIIDHATAPFVVKLVVPLVAALLLVRCPPRSRVANRAALAVAVIYLAVTLWNVMVIVRLVG